MARASIRHLVLAAAVAVSGCVPGTNPFGAKDQPNAEPAAAGSAAPATSVRLVDHDVEAPEVFQVTDQALWDGRPSLGGVWVASPDAVDPERVILRNPGNGKFVIGALFRRERDNPGPRLQISSDAADALGMLAGEPASLNITALRRQETPQAAPDATKPILDAAEAVQTTALDPVAVAGAALDAVDAKAQGTTAPQPPPSATAPSAAAPTTAAPAGNLVLQVGIFSVEANAGRAAAKLTKAGIASEIRPGQTQGKAFWSVVAKGAGTKAGFLAAVKAVGFTDAYFVAH